MEKKLEQLAYYKAIEWIKKNTIPQKGIVVSSTKRHPYLEVTGYLIPSLMEAKEYHLAEQYAEFLSYMQRPNGSFAGPDSREYIFDSGQVLRGLVRAALQWERFIPYARKTADFILSKMDQDGRLASSYDENIPEAVHVFVLPALIEASELLSDTQYKIAAKKTVNYYKNVKDVLSQDVLTHFYGYILDGFIDLGEKDFVYEAVQNLFRRQKSNGSISAYPQVNWVCSVGLAQLGIIALKLKMNKQANKIVDYLLKHQRVSGGFLGSYGLRAKYFPKEEISWANKFFVDLLYLKTEGIVQENRNIDALNHEQWHKAMVGETVEQMKDRLKKNDFAIWVQPLLEKTQPKEVILELGSGTGELSAILAMYDRNMHLLDYSKDSIEHIKSLFKEMNLNAQYYVADILNEFPVSQNSVDWVYSSGVLEHFTDEQVIAVMKRSAFVARKGVMSFVPNSQSVFYRVGKLAQERSGKWIYGKETPCLSMRPYFEAASLKNIQEYSIAPYHALKFFGDNNPEIRDYYDTLPPDQLKRLNQGYLLFTYGEKNA